MPKNCRVALVGDYSSSVVAHQAIPEALRLAATETGRSIESQWVPTRSVSTFGDELSPFDGIWCVPGSPYENTDGALGAIRFAREHGRPFLGTCGGFQHAALEYARNVRGLSEAEHAELNPGAALLVIVPLACSLVEQSDQIILTDESLIRKAYCRERIQEGYHCRYGINAEHMSNLFDKDLRPTGYDAKEEVRAIELASHPFFVATLFQPERRALKGEAPPLAIAFAAAL